MFERTSYFIVGVIHILVKFYSAIFVFFGTSNVLVLKNHVQYFEIGPDCKD